jgi:AcrR family transcriptional regulator
VTSIAPAPNGAGRSDAGPTDACSSGTLDRGEGASERPLRRDAELNRQRILVAAAEVFATRGLDVSLDDVARHANLGVGTVYRRFPTKELLVEALFEEHLDALASMVERALDAENPWDGFVTALTEVCTLHANNRGLREILLSSAYGQGCASRARMRLEPAVDMGLRRAQDAGYLRADIGQVDMRMIEFMIGGVAQYTKHVPDAWRRYLDIVIDGLRARPDLAPPSVPALTDEQVDDAMTSWLPARRNAER